MTRTLTVHALCAELGARAAVARMETDDLVWQFEPVTGRVFTRDEDGHYAVCAMMFGRSSAGRHIVAAQPAMVLALIAKLRDAQRIVAQTRLALGRLELDWHLSDLTRELTAFDAIEVP